MVTEDVHDTLVEKEIETERERGGEREWGERGMGELEEESKREREWDGGEQERERGWARAEERDGRARGREKGRDRVATEKGRRRKETKRKREIMGLCLDFFLIFFTFCFSFYSSCLCVVVVSHF